MGAHAVTVGAVGVDSAVAPCLGLVRRNSLRVSGETLRSNSRRKSVHEAR